MIKITYEFETEGQALRFLARDTASKSEAAAPQKVPAIPKTAAPAPAPAVPPVQATVSPVAPAPKQEPSAAAPTTTAAAGPAPTGTGIEEARLALRKVFNGKGAPAATAILKKFGATSISTVQPTDYAAFIKDCEAAA